MISSRTGSANAHSTSTSRIATVAGWDTSRIASWLGLAPAELGLVAAGVTALTLLWHLGTTRRPVAPAPVKPAPTSASPENSK
ncbi:hypothetical protein [Streptomyces sp. NPDC057748]